MFLGWLGWIAARLLVYCSYVSLCWYQRLQALILIRAVVMWFVDVGMRSTWALLWFGGVGWGLSAACLVDLFYILLLCSHVSSIHCFRFLKRLRFGLIC